MKAKNHNQLNDLLAILSPAVPNNTDAAQEEPLTYQRRGRRFNSSIAHHSRQISNYLAANDISPRHSH
jgi:hypothetical protein